MRFVTPADFDFALAGWYRKVKKLSFADVRQADHAEEIITHNSGGVETRNMAQPGDYILRGSSDRYGGQGYIVTADRFAEIYEIDPDLLDHYRNKEVRRALLVLDDVSFVSPWGVEQHINAGGVVVEAGPYIYGVDKFSFIKNYARADDTESHSVFALLNEPLDVQHDKAQTAGRDNHLRDIVLRLENAQLFA